MKVLLVQPPHAKVANVARISCFEPLGLEYVAGGIIDRHDVQIIDMRIDKNLDHALKTFNPDVVGITSLTVNVNTVKGLFQKAKAYDSAIFTVVGGHHATILPEDFFEPEIDLVVMGEGVKVFKEVIDRLESDRDFSSIKGVAYRNGNEQVINPADLTVGLEGIPFPARELTEKYRNQYYWEWMKPVATIRTSKGCPFRCKFCSLWKIAGKKYHIRTPEDIIEELSQIKEEYIFFADDESLVDAKRMMVLAKAIKKAGIKKRYFIYGRTDTINNNPELIDAWKEIGLEAIHVGFEFFRDKDLKEVNKRTTTSTHEATVKILHDAGVLISASFIVKPDFTESDFEELKQYCRKLKLTMIGFTVLTPLPGTDLHSEYQDSLITNNYDFYDLFYPIIPTKLPLKDFFKQLISLFTSVRTHKQGMEHLKRYPLRRIPSVIAMYSTLLKNMKKAYSNYTS